LYSVRFRQQVTRGWGKWCGVRLKVIGQGVGIDEHGIAGHEA
jgi:hypothetical protein